MSLGGYRASLRAGSKSILMLVTESHNSADLQWSGVSNIILSTMETPQVKCRYVCVCVCVYAEHTRAHFSPFLWPSEHFVCLLPHHALHWGCECICMPSLDCKHCRSKIKKFLLCFIMLTVLSKWLCTESSSQGYGFSCGHVWMWELDCEEGWAPKNWCFWTVVLEKTLETPVLWPPHAKSWLTGKDSDAGRDWGQEEKGTTEDEMAGWHRPLNGRESQWTPGVGDGQGGLACCDSWGRKESDMTEPLIWSDLMHWMGTGVTASSSNRAGSEGALGNTQRTAHNPQVFCALPVVLSHHWHHSS